MLEGVVSVPDNLSGQLPGVVIAHPHPAFGGNMDHPMVKHLGHALNEAGVVSFTFNFRGVGHSQGTFSNGEQEPQDLRAALELMKIWRGVNGKKLALVGYSFGAGMILRGLHMYKAAQAFALVSPPLSSFDDSRVAKDRRPQLFLVGEDDRLVDPAKLQERVANWDVPATVEIVSAADHLWRGLETQVAERVVRFLARALVS